MKTNYICTGAFVYSNRTRKSGFVISVNSTTGVVVVKSAANVWTESAANVVILSYLGVE